MHPWGRPTSHARSLWGGQGARDGAAVVSAGPPPRCSGPSTRRPAARKARPRGPPDRPRRPPVSAPRGAAQALNCTWSTPRERSPKRASSPGPSGTHPHPHRGSPRTTTTTRSRQEGSRRGTTAALRRLQRTKVCSWVRTALARSPRRIASPWPRRRTADGRTRDDRRGWAAPRSGRVVGGGRGGGFGTRPGCYFVCLWRRPLASRHCAL